MSRITSNAPFPHPRSVLSIVPSKENDGSTYRCTIWNRALGQSRKFEASTDIFVNCECQIS